MLPCDGAEVLLVKSDARTKNVIAVVAPGPGAEAGESFLRSHWALDVWPDTEHAATAEDLTRTQKLKENSLRKKYRREYFRATGVEGSRNGAEEAAFLKKLGMQFELKCLCTESYHPGEKAAEELLARVSQLSLRSNQMNTTQLRLTTKGAVVKWLASGAEPHRFLVALSVKDKFGDLGLMAQAFCEVVSDDDSIKTKVACFNMSCRVLGRGVARRLLESVLAISRKNTASAPAAPIHLCIPVITTQRNILVRNFLDSIGTQRNGATASWESHAVFHEGWKFAQPARALYLCGLGGKQDLLFTSSSPAPVMSDHASGDEVAPDAGPDWSELLTLVAKGRLGLRGL